MTTKAQSTRQLLIKIPHVNGLYRHSVNQTYYGIKKISGKRKEHSLGTTDRKVAERKLVEWIEGLGKLDASAGKTTLDELIKKFVASRQGLSESTRDTDASILKRFKNEWKHGLEIQVSEIKPSHIGEWLASVEGGVKNSTYNRYCGVVQEMFLIAVKDKIILDSPFDGVRTKWKKPQKPKRVAPTRDEFHAIVGNIRATKHNADAEDSADFIEFLGLAGLGQAEAASLTFGDIDWTKNVLHIKRQKTEKRFPVPIYEWLKPLLERLCKSEDGASNPAKNVFKIKDAKKALFGACRRLGYHQFTQRNIRASLIRLLWQSNVDIKLIAKWQGHQDGGKLILDTYTELFGSDDADYIDVQLAKVKYYSDRGL